MKKKNRLKDSVTSSRGTSEGALAPDTYCATCEKRLLSAGHLLLITRQAGNTSTLRMGSLRFTVMTLPQSDRDSKWLRCNTGLCHTCLALHHSVLWPGDCKTLLLCANNVFSARPPYQLESSSSSLLHMRTDKSLTRQRGRGSHVLHKNKLREHCFATRYGLVGAPGGSVS